jgi:hypothetical protein
VLACRDTHERARTQPPNCRLIHTQIFVMRSQAVSPRSLACGPPPGQLITSVLAREARTKHVRARDSTSLSYDAQTAIHDDYIQNRNVCIPRVSSCRVRPPKHPNATPIDRSQQTRTTNVVPTSCYSGAAASDDETMQPWS